MSWQYIERNIIKTIDFLRENIDPSPYTQNNPIKCNECLLRMISILIVSGKIYVTKINYKNNQIWAPENYDLKDCAEKPHGAMWHNNMMNMIKDYFKSRHLNVYSEPNLHHGKADLYIKEINTYIEVGSVDLYKLYLNSSFINGSKIILVPSEFYCLEFKL